MLYRGGHVAFHHRLRLIVTDRAIAADDADDGTGHATLVRVAWPVVQVPFRALVSMRSEEHTSELQSLMRHSYAVFCLKKKTPSKSHNNLTILRTTSVDYC